MSVYVDDMYRSPMGRYGRMKMSHMLADTREELLAMADTIGLNRKWLQHEGQGRSREHFDVSMTMRAKVIAAGAQEITMIELGRMTIRWRREDKENESTGKASG